MRVLIDECVPKAQKDYPRRKPQLSTKFNRTPDSDHCYSGSLHRLEDLQPHFAAIVLVLSKVKPGEIAQVGVDL
jgi:hypothetical protein